MILDVHREFEVILINDFCGSLNRNILFEANEREKTWKIRMKDDTWEGIRMCPINLATVQSFRDTKVEENGGKALIVVSDADKYPEDVDPPWRSSRINARTGASN